jgi:hypothetical protein
LDDSDAQASGVWPDLEALARPARERRRLPPDTRSRIILELCERAPLSVKELSLLLDRSEAYVGDAIRPLVTAGDLTFLYPDQPRHPKQKYLAAADQRSPAIVVPAEAPPIFERQSMPSLAAERLPAERIVTNAERLRAPAAPAPSRFPNQLTNIVVVVVTGILLATLDMRWWFFIALLTAFALSFSHIVAHSSQYEKFRELQTASHRRSLSFVVLKSGVAMIEIMLVYFVAHAIAS